MNRSIAIYLHVFLALAVASGEARLQEPTSPRVLVVAPSPKIFSIRLAPGFDLQSLTRLNTLITEHRPFVQDGDETPRDQFEACYVLIVTLHHRLVTQTGKARALLNRAEEQLAEARRKGDELISRAQLLGGADLARAERTAAGWTKRIGERRDSLAARLAPLSGLPLSRIPLLRSRRVPNGTDPAIQYLHAAFFQPTKRRARRGAADAAKQLADSWMRGKTSIPEAQIRLARDIHSTSDPESIAAQQQRALDWIMQAATPFLEEALTEPVTPERPKLALNDLIKIDTSSGQVTLVLDPRLCLNRQQEHPLHGYDLKEFIGDVDYYGLVTRELEKGNPEHIRVQAQHVLVNRVAKRLEAIRGRRHRLTTRGRPSNASGQREVERLAEEKLRPYYRMSKKELLGEPLSEAEAVLWGQGYLELLRIFSADPVSEGVAPAEAIRRVLKPAPISKHSRKR
ncbi:MAG: hypothetical protein NXI31_06020 [bacterium]|nr:hypothetical protein [bacterium]